MKNTEYLMHSYFQPFSIRKSYVWSNFFNSIDSWKSFFVSSIISTCRYGTAVMSCVLTWLVFYLVKSSTTVYIFSNLTETPIKVILMIIHTLFTFWALTNVLWYSITYSMLSFQWRHICCIWSNDKAGGVAGLILCAASLDNKTFSRFSFFL